MAGVSDVCSGDLVTVQEEQDGSQQMTPPHVRFRSGNDSSQQMFGTVRSTFLQLLHFDTNININLDNYIFHVSMIMVIHMYYEFDCFACLPQRSYAVRL